ncbi:hypothetical protein J4433_00660 [Candidatus Pacearchaeota archaeon]|nr:hypothetical protein [Candidatus Pacearchaeota archaeon]
MKKCIYCNGELKLVEDFFKQHGEEQYDELRKEFRENIGVEMKKLEDYNCIECGRIYDKNLEPTKFSLGWLAKNDN